jgi:hypothetical protein
VTSGGCGNIQGTQQIIGGQVTNLGGNFDQNYYGGSSSSNFGKRKRSLPFKVKRSPQFYQNYAPNAHYGNYKGTTHGSSLPYIVGYQPYGLPYGSFQIHSPHFAPGVLPLYATSREFEQAPTVEQVVPVVSPLPIATNEIVPAVSSVTEQIVPVVQPQPVEKVQPIVEAHSASAVGTSVVPGVQKELITPAIQTEVSSVIGKGVSPVSEGVLTPSDAIRTAITDKQVVNLRLFPDCLVAILLWGCINY